MPEIGPHLLWLLLCFQCLLALVFMKNDAVLLQAICDSTKNADKNVIVHSKTDLIGLTKGKVVPRCIELYSDLSEAEAGDLRMYCKKKLENVGMVEKIWKALSNFCLCSNDSAEVEEEMMLESSKDEVYSKAKELYLTSVLACFRGNEKKVLSEVIDLIRYLNEKGTTTVSIFRREGRKVESRNIINQILLGKQVDFERYGIYPLASGLKYYIREILDGLFDKASLDKLYDAVQGGNRSEIRRLSKLLVFSLNPSVRECFMELRELLQNIAQNSHINQMTWDSLTNILSLTTMPCGIFTDAASAFVCIDMFKAIMKVEANKLEDLRSVVIRQVNGKE